MSNQIFIPGISRAALIAKPSCRNIVAVDFTVANETGVTFPDTDIETVLRALGSVATDQKATIYQGIIRVTIRPAGAAPATARPGAPSTAVQALAHQVNQLQGWASLTDAERLTRQTLTAAVRTKDEAVRGLTEELRQGLSRQSDLISHLEALKAHELPAELFDSLQKVAAQRDAAVGEIRQALGTKVAALQEARQALTAELTRPILSAEATLSGVDEALSAAQDLAGPAPTEATAK